MLKQRCDYYRRRDLSILKFEASGLKVNYSASVTSSFLLLFFLSETFTPCNNQILTRFSTVVFLSCIIGIRRHTRVNDYMRINS